MRFLDKVVARASILPGNGAKRILAREENYANLAGEVFGVVAGAPGIVVGGEAGPVGDGGMAVEPEFHKGVGIGRFEVVFAKGDEGFLGGDLRIRHKAVNGFLAEDVGLVLFPSTEGVGDRGEEKVDAGEDEQQHGEGGKVAGSANLPAGTEAADERVDGEIGNPEQHDQHGHGESEAFIDVVENVVAHFMADDEENLIRRKLADGVVPNDDAGGGTDAGDVGIFSGGFFAGFHEEHARRGNVEAGVVGELLQLRGEGGIALRERGKVVEDGINPNGRNEDGEDNDGEGAGPEPEPPCARGDADDEEEQKQQRRDDKQREAERLELIEVPAGPGLHGDSVGAFDVLAVDVEWERDNA